MGHNVYLYILGMWAISYLIRVLPLTLIRREITNRTIRSFLYYVPYAVLSAMTFPAILYATGSFPSACAALAIALALAWMEKSLLTVAIAASAAALIVQAAISMI